MGGLEQHYIGAAFYEGGDLFEVEVAHVVEAEPAGYEQGFVGGAYGGGHVAGPGWRGVFLGRGFGEFCAGEVEFAHAGGNAVFGEHGGIGAESVGLHEVRPRGQVILVHFRDGVGL